VGSYSVQILRSAAKEIESAPRKDRERIIARISALSEDPRPTGTKRLAGREAYRIRQGDYRIVYTISDPDRIVEIARVARRSDAYRSS
jgi:mRNA interferase RelE/StbE